MCVFFPPQEHPYIFTKVTEPPQRSEDTVPVWLAAVLAVVGLVVGCGVTGLLCYCTTKRNKKHNISAAQSKTTGF